MQEENPYLNQKFGFDEIVIIHSNKPQLIPFNGKRGVIVAKIDPDDYRPGDRGVINYGVDIEGVKNGWCVDEDDLEATGQILTDEIWETWELAEGKYRFRDKC